MIQLLATGLGVGDVMAFAFRMVRGKTEYLDVSYGLIVKISKAVPVKGGRKIQTSIAWDDEHATYLCRWFRWFVPVLGESGKACEIGGKKAFVMPIHCAYGSNWEVHAKLC
jgi:hypothetical protein